MPRADPPSAPVLTIENLVWLHTVAIAEFGGFGRIRERGLLESALARPLAGFGGKPLSPTPTQRAAALLEALIRNHGFVDGNKRTAVMAMGAWLDREGLELSAARGELRDLALAIAERRTNTPDIAGWLAEHTRPAPGKEDPRHEPSR